MHFHGNEGQLRFHEESHQVFAQNIDFDTDLSGPLPPWAALPVKY